MTDPNKEHFIADGPIFSDAPSGSCDEGVVERAYRAFVDRACEITGTNEADAMRNMPEEALAEFRDALGCAVAAALSTPSPTLTPEGIPSDILADFKDHPEILARLTKHVRSLTPAIRDQALEEATREDAIREALGAYSLSGGTLEQSLTGFIGNLEFYSTLADSLGDSTREEFARAAKVIRALKGTPPSPAEPRARDGHTLPVTNPPDFEYPLPDDDLGPIIGGREE